ncbi:LysR family transcriptional regulator [Pseudahrensia aquimaris]|uniref:LysR family transcriptional regulator n=1 Tax=Pseudahrensia aquimaris TaxID=744461 RepID=A0ABW3FJB7_9HYPH
MAARDFSVDDLRLLALVAEAGSMNAAAKRFDISKSVLSRAVSKLEGLVGGPLFDRTQKGMVPTETGKVLLPVAKQALSVVRDAEEAIRSAKGTPQGELKIACSALSGQQLVAPAVAEMARLYPKVETTLRVSSRGPDPLAEDLDLVLRIGKPPEAYLASRELIASRFALYTFRSRAAEVDLNDPDSVETLGRIVIAIDQVPEIWKIEHPDGREKILSSKPLVRVGDPTVAIGILNAGSGVALIPQVYGEPLANAGALVRAMPGWLGPTIEIHAAMPPRRASVPAVAAFLDILSHQAERLQQMV